MAMVIEKFWVSNLGLLQREQDIPDAPAFIDGALRIRMSLRKRCLVLRINR